VVYLLLSKMMEFVSWDDDIPNVWKIIKKNMFQTTNQYLLGSYDGWKKSCTS